MEPTTLIIGLGITAFLLLYFIFNLQKDLKDSPWHIALRLLVILFFFIILMLIPKASLDERDNCEMTLQNMTRTYSDSQNFTEVYKSDYYCVTNSKTTTVLFYTTILWLWRILLSFIGLYLFYELIMYMKKIIKK